MTEKNAKTTEKEKMQSGELYDANFDKELLAERDKCKALCFAYNRTPYENKAEREKILRQIIPSAKQNVTIEPDFWCDYGYNIELGENFYSNHNLVVLDGAKVAFGDNVFIGPNCAFYTAGHPLDAARRNKGLEYAKPVCVGNNVWIGGNVVVCAGVTIGDGCVIGAGSVVVKDIEAGSLAVGNPCRVIRKITP